MLLLFLWVTLESPRIAMRLGVYKPYSLSEHLRRITPRCSSLHKHQDTQQLFSGTSPCFELAREFLDGLALSTSKRVREPCMAAPGLASALVPGLGTRYDVVGGNHELEASHTHVSTLGPRRLWRLSLWPVRCRASTSSARTMKT